MTVRCITCQHFSLKPRTGELAHYAATDRTHARAGKGRCASETLALHYEDAEAPKACDKHEPAGEEVTAKRREWMKGIRGGK